MHRVETRTVLDPNNGILLIFTPRAACTLATSIFFHHMGEYQKIDQDLINKFSNPNKMFFIHAFRKDYRPIVYSIDANYLKIKFIRNPYRRAVSCYLFCGSHYWQMKNISFRKFLLNIKDNKIQNKNIAKHLVPQYDEDTEKYVDEYVKVENIEMDLERIDKQHGTRFLESYRQLNKDSIFVSHKAIRNKDITEFVGNATFIEIVRKYGIPAAEYRFFYNDEIKELVDEIYRDDIQKYNYNFSDAM